MSSLIQNRVEPGNIPNRKRRYLTTGLIYIHVFVSRYISCYTALLNELSPTRTIFSVSRTSVGRGNELQS